MGDGVIGQFVASKVEFGAELAHNRGVLNYAIKCFFIGAAIPVVAVLALGAIMVFLAAFMSVI